MHDSNYIWKKTKDVQYSCSICPCKSAFLYILWVKFMSCLIRPFYSIKLWSRESVFPMHIKFAHFLFCSGTIYRWHVCFSWPQKNIIAHQQCYLLFPLGADVINFDGHVVLPYRFRNKKMKTLKDVISLKFKTSESEGVIFHGEGQQGDYITLELKKAKLVLNLNLGILRLFSSVHFLTVPQKF